MYICNVFAFIITVNTSTQSPCQGIPWISPEEVLCAYTWLQVSWYFLHSTWYTFFVGETYLQSTTHVSASYLATKKCIIRPIRPMTFGTYGRCMVVVYTWILRKIPSWFTKMLGAHDLNFAAKRMDLHRSVAWRPAADLNWNKAVRHHTLQMGLDIDETIDATKIIRFHTLFMKIQWWRGFYESDPVYHLLEIKLILSIYCVALLTISRKHSTSRKRSVAVLGSFLQYLEPDLLSLLR